MLRELITACSTRPNRDPTIKALAPPRRNPPRIPKPDATLDTDIMKTAKPTTATTTSQPLRNEWKAPLRAFLYNWNVAQIRSDI